MWPSKLNKYCWQGQGRDGQNRRNDVFKIEKLTNNSGAPIEFSIYRRPFVIKRRTISIIHTIMRFYFSFLNLRRVWTRKLYSSARIKLWTCIDNITFCMCHWAHWHKQQCTAKFEWLDTFLIFLIWFHFVHFIHSNLFSVLQLNILFLKGCVSILQFLSFD